MKCRGSPTPPSNHALVHWRSTTASGPQANSLTCTIGSKSVAAGSKVIVTSVADGGRNRYTSSRPSAVPQAALYRPGPRSSPITWVSVDGSVIGLVHEPTRPSTGGGKSPEGSPLLLLSSSEVIVSVSPVLLPGPG